MSSPASTAPARERASATPVYRPTRGHVAARSGASRPPLEATLEELESWFAYAVMHPDGVTAGRDDGPRIAGTVIGPGEIERLVLPSASLAPIDRVDIYRQAYTARLVECLADDYPALKYALGDEAFEALCHDYIFEHPSRSPNLNRFGQHMSAFVRRRGGPVSLFCSDLSSLEWAMVEVVHEARSEPFSEEALGKTAPERWIDARLIRSPAVRVLTFGYPVNAYFQSFNTDGAPTLPPAGASATAVFRDGPTLWRMDLEPAMLALLQELFGGAPLGAALEGVAGRGLLGEREAPRVMGWFRDWMRYGFFERICFDEPAGASGAREPGAPPAGRGP